MDHLLRPRNSVFPPVEIPYLDNEDYDGNDYETYAERRGWGPRTPGDWYLIFENPDVQFQAFLQTWLFFGLIYKTLGTENIRLSQLVKSVGNPPRTVVDTSALIPLEKIWNAGLGPADGERARAFSIAHNFEAHLLSESPKTDPSDGLHKSWHEQMRLQLCGGPGVHLIPVERRPIVGLLEYVRLWPVPRSPHHPAVSLSVKLLLDLIFTLGFWSLGSENQTVRFGRLRPENLLPRWESLVTERMRSAGWCPYQISVLHEKLSAPCLTFISGLDRPDSVHHPSVDTMQMDSQNVSLFSIGLCNVKRCAMTQINEEDYQTKHVRGCVGCENMRPDENELFEILAAGSFPLILSIDEDDESSTITLVEAGPDIAYIAISHVWSDGLGNVHENSIPRCQMLALSKKIRNMGPVKDILLFWLDTICVPRSKKYDQRARLCKTAAISRMRDTYEQAQHVLVLDAGLLSREMAGLPHSEKLLTILSSNWNSRLWTLQEGTMARHLWFQFADEAYPSDTGLHRVREEEGHYEQFSLVPTIWLRFADFRSGGTTKFPLFAKLIAAMHALRGRSTSLHSDEAICLATILNLDPVPVISADPQLRMVVLWSMINSVPARIIFWNAEKLSAAGLRWAPASLLRSEESPENRFLTLPNYWESVEAVPTADGLMTSFPGYIIKAMKGANIGESFVFVDNNDRWYRVQLRVERGDKIAIPYTDPSNNKVFAVNPWAATSGSNVSADNSHVSLYLVTDGTFDFNNQPISPTVRGILAVPVLQDWIQPKWAADLAFYETHLASRALKANVVCTVGMKLVSKSQVSRRMEHFGIPIQSMDTRNQCVALRDHESGDTRMEFTYGIQTQGNQTWCID